MESNAKTPKGLLILGSLQIFVALSRLWGLIYHENLKWEFKYVFIVMVTLSCGVMGVGLVKMKTWAYRTFIAIYVIYILGYVSGVMAGQAPSGLTLSQYRLDNLKAALVCSVFLAWLFSYRRFFLKHKNGPRAVPIDRQG